MKARTLIKFTFVMGSLCVSAWQMPAMIDKIEQTMGRAPGTTGAPGAGPTGVAGLMGALSAQPQGQPTSIGAMMNAMGAGAGPRGAHAAERKDPAPMKIEEMTLFSPDGKPLTKEQQERLLKEAARLAPRPGVHVSPSKQR